MMAMPALQMMPEAGPSVWSSVAAIGGMLAMFAAPKAWNRLQRWRRWRQWRRDVVRQRAMRAPWKGNSR